MLRLFATLCDWRSCCSVDLREKSGTLHILFVCTGNICRSPLAERAATAYAARLNVADFEASSAGTNAVVGHEIHHLAVPPLERLGGIASGFAARQLTPKVALSADLILTMTKSHRDRVLELAPNMLRRTFTLVEAATLVSRHEAQSVADLAEFRARVGVAPDLDIPDPIGREAEYFEQVGSRIGAMLPPILELCRFTQRGPRSS